MNNESKKSIKTSFLTTVSALFNLTMMQLKEKMNFSFKQNLKKSLFSLSFFVIGFAAITVLCYFLIFFAKKMGIFDLNGSFPTNVLVCVFTVMFVLSVIFTTISLVQSLYFSRDNFVLLTLPTTPSVVFLSKLLVHYVNEMKKNFLFLIPLFIAYGINTKLPFYYYPWVLFLFLLVVTLPVLIGALLSIPAMFLYQAIRKVKGLLYVIIAGNSIGCKAVQGIKRIYISQGRSFCYKAVRIKGYVLRNIGICQSQTSADFAQCYKIQFIQIYVI